MKTNLRNSVGRLKMALVTMGVLALVALAINSIIATWRWPDTLYYTIRPGPGPYFSNSLGGPRLTVRFATADVSRTGDTPVFGVEEASPRNWIDMVLHILGLSDGRRSIGYYRRTDEHKTLNGEPWHVLMRVDAPQ